MAKLVLALLLSAIVAPSLASAASNVDFEITNKTSEPLLVTSTKSQCMEIPYRTNLPAGKLSKFHIEWNSHGSCKIQDSYTDLEFTAPNSKRRIGSAHLLSSRDPKFPVAGKWTLRTIPERGFCMPPNGYDQITVNVCK